MKNSKIKHKMVGRHHWTLQMFFKSKLKQKTVWRHPFPTDDVPVQNEVENCRETIRSSRKGWHWKRIYKRGEFTPNRSDILGKRKYSSSYIELLQLKISSDCTSLRKLLIMLLLKQISMQGCTLKQKRTTSGLILQLKNRNQLTWLIC